MEEDWVMALIPLRFTFYPKAHWSLFRLWVHRMFGIVFNYGQFLTMLALMAAAVRYGWEALSWVTTTP